MRTPKFVKIRPNPKRWMNQQERRFFRNVESVMNLEIKRIMDEMSIFGCSIIGGEKR